MPIESAADRAAFLADFGEAIIWRVAAGQTAETVALFDYGTINSQLQDTVSALNRRGTLTMREADLPADAGGATDIITVRGATYCPKEVAPDGQGMVVVMLEQVEVSNSTAMLDFSNPDNSQYSGQVV